MSRRMERVNVLLRQEVSWVLAEEVKDPRVSAVVSVTRVETSLDLGVSRVYVSVMGDGGDQQDTLKALRSAAGFVRRVLHKRIALRSVPEIHFLIDHSIERGAEVLKIIGDASQGGKT